MELHPEGDQNSAEAEVTREQIDEAFKKFETAVDDARAFVLELDKVFNPEAVERLMASTVSEAVGVIRSFDPEGLRNGIVPQHMGLLVALEELAVFMLESAEKFTPEDSARIIAKVEELSEVRGRLELAHQLKNKFDDLMEKTRDLANWHASGKEGDMVE